MAAKKLIIRDKNKRTSQKTTRGRRNHPLGYGLVCEGHKVHKPHKRSRWRSAPPMKIIDPIAKPQSQRFSDQVEVSGFTRSTPAPAKQKQKLAQPQKTFQLNLQPWRSLIEGIATAAISSADHANFTSIKLQDPKQKNPARPMARNSLANTRP